MDIALVIIGGLLLIVGLLGCVMPILIGPPLSFAGLLCLHFSKYGHFTTDTLILLGILTLAATFLDNLFPVIAAKKFGGSDRAVTGSIIGMLAGIFVLPPAGMVAGAFLGALIGELTLGSKILPSLKASFGTFLGFIAGVIFKVLCCGFMLFFYAIHLIKNIKV